MSSDPTFNFKLRSGTTIAGRYELSRLLGRGGMGEVWAAKHVALEANHAIKFMEPSLLAEHDAETVVDRFEDEAKATSAISRLSRHVVAVSDYGKHDGIPYLVMEHLEGESLEALMVREKVFAPSRVVAILEQVCRGVTQAHKANLIHRDLKPGNVFVCKDETGELLVKVLDFGLVRSVAEGNKRLTQRGIAVGTPNYMSPEQARAHHHMDQQCDIWSMAVLAYEMLTGKSPWVGETMQDVLVAVCRSEFLPPSQVKPDLGAFFDDLFERAFQRKAENRFPSAEAFIAALRESALRFERRPVTVDVDHPPDSAYTSSDSLTVPKRGGWKLPALAVFALLLTGGIGITLKLLTRDEEPRHAAAATLSATTAPTARATIPAPEPQGTAQTASSAPAASASATAKAVIPSSAAGSGRSTTGPAPVMTTAPVPDKPAPAPPATAEPPHVAPPPTPTRGPVDQSKIL